MNVVKTVKNEYGRFIAMLVSAVLVTVSANARTVALWTMDPTVMPDGRKLLRCAVTPRNDLTLGTDSTVTSPAQSVGWNLPPNPDESSVFIRSVVSRQCVKVGGINNKEQIISSTEPRLAKAVAPDHDFTIEGWMNIDEFPNDNGRILLFAGINGYGSYMLRIDPKSGDGAKRNINLVWRHAANNPLTICSVDDAAITKAWHHYAFVFTFEKANGKSGWSFYLDGSEIGSVEHYQLGSVSVDARFIIGGTSTSAEKGNNIVGSFDYWRISDKALLPSEFLCAGGVGSSVPVNANRRTVAYWKLGHDAEGNVDARDYVGTADLSQGIYAGNTDYMDATVMDPAEPRPSVESHDGKGAVKFSSSQKGKGLQHATLGTDLVFDRSFSVEGWIKPMWRGEEADQVYLCGTLDNYDPKCRGWLLILQKQSSGYRFLVGAQDGVPENPYDFSGRGNLTMGASGFNNAAVMSGVYPFDEQWRKIRLSYTATSAGEQNKWNGKWELYVDDELAGTADHGRMYDSSVASLGKSFTCFYIGSTSRARTFHGLVDDWSVSVEGNEIAHWPFNVNNGVDLDLRDEHETYSFAPFRDLSVSAGSEGPAVTNPDRTAHFDGNPAVHSGSVSMGDEQDNEKGYLAVSDSTLLNALNVSLQDWTLEGWVKMDGELLDKNSAMICGISKTLMPPSSGAFGFYVNIVRVDGRLTIQAVDNGLFAREGMENRVICRVTDEEFPQKEWTHFAVVRQCLPNDQDHTDRFVFKVYLNGVLKQTSEGYRHGAPAAKQIFFGGNPAYDFKVDGESASHNLPGSISSFRFSVGALEPSEFLNAKSEPESESDSTIAYWPLENRNGDVDGAVAVGKGGYEIYQGGTGTIGQSDAARRKLEAEGMPSANNGSILVGGNPIFADYVGAFVSPSQTKPWSVEGYFKNDKGGMICRMGEVGSGWQLDYDPVKSLFSLRATAGLACSPCASGTFSASFFEAGDWNHILLTFDPSGELPVWELYVNGKSAGRVTSVWRGASVDYGGLFGLGEGSFDMWRVSKRVLSVEESLYRSRPGLWIVIR